jgi:large subunit ribosomal protein L3
MPGIIGRKIGMTRVIQEDGLVEPVTLVSCPAGKVVQIKSTEKDGYNAIVVGFEALKKPTKTRKFRKLKEFKIDDTSNYKNGDDFTLNILNEVASVRVTGTSKGHGYSGVIKRWNFSRGPESHGSHHHREPGSVGQCAKPGRVQKGKKLPGQYGNETVTRCNVKVVKLDAKNNIIALKGPVPGGRNNFVFISIEA